MATFFKSLILLALAVPALPDKPAPAAQPPQVAWGTIRQADSEWELEVDDAAELAGGVVAIPRLNNPIGNVYLRGDAARMPLRFAPQVREWHITLPEGARTGRQTIVLETVGPPQVTGQPRVVAPAKDGTITLPAHDAVTHGENLRYEPQPHKNTVGYWSRQEDWCQWHFSVERPGSYEVWVLQGCGKGQGGSEVAARIGEREIKFTVEETGHFQNFKNRLIGTVKLDKSGQHMLELRPLSKAAAAVMDVRQVRLIPVR